MPLRSAKNFAETREKKTPPTNENEDNTVYAIGFAPVDGGGSRRKDTGGTARYTS